MKKPDERKIGEQFRSTVTIRICKPCGCEITELGMCSYGCQYDSRSLPPRFTTDALPNRPWTAYVYARVDRLVGISRR